jgi:integrase
VAERISEKLVRAIEPPERGNKIAYDDALRGFGVRVTAGGARSFILNYRVAGRERRYTIGKHPAWSAAAARIEAADLRQRVDRGEDPMEERREDREAPTMGTACDRYIEEHLPKKRPSSRRNDTAMIENIIRPRWGAWKLADVDFTDVDKLHTSMKATPYRANRCIALVSKLFNLSIRWRWRLDNPAKGVEKFPEVKRRRYLSTDELGRLTAALAGHNDQKVANVVRLLLLTGARKGEVLGARWDDIDLERATWTKPAALTKQRSEHVVPLSAPTRQLLAEMRESTTGDFLFPGRDPEKPLTDIKTSWARICKAADLEGVRLHDIRHTYASILASAGLSLPVIGALLGHTQPATTQRYAHLFDDPLRQAAERVGAIVTGAGKEGATVVRLRDEEAAP